MAKVKEIIYGLKNYGIVGTPVPKTNYCVGDIIAFKATYTFGASVVVDARQTLSPNDEPFCLMGSISQGLTTSKDFQYGDIIVSHKYLTDEILKGICENMALVESERVFMTLEEIEEKLGYKVHLVQEKC
jgi:hypothetical protein